MKKTKEKKAVVVPEIIDPATINKVVISAKNVIKIKRFAKELNIDINNVIEFALTDINTQMVKHHLERIPIIKELQGIEFELTDLEEKRIERSNKKRLLMSKLDKV